MAVAIVAVVVVVCATTRAH